MSDIFTRWSQQLAEHPNLRELYYRGLHDFESLEGADLVGFGTLMLRAVSNSARKPIIDTWRGIWIHACGMGGKRPCAISTDILEFRLGGVHARIGSMRSLRSYINQLQQTAKPPRLYREPMKDE